jgi:hypothetical protein
LVPTALDRHYRHTYGHCLLAKGLTEGGEANFISAAGLGFTHSLAQGMQVSPATRADEFAQYLFCIADPAYMPFSFYSLPQFVVELDERVFWAGNC